MTLMSRFAALFVFLVAPSTAAAQFTLEARFASRLPPGPHAVGFRVVEQYDGTRLQVDATEYALHADRYVRGRPMQTLIWYPARPSGTAAPMRFREYAELFSADGSFPASGDGAVAGLLDYLHQRDSSASVVQRELGSPVRAFRNAAAAAGKFPVIVYAPGTNAPAFLNEQLGEFLASHGYIFVASPSWGPLGETETVARDLEYLVAFARTLPNAEPTRVALMGHSLGGVAVVMVAARNPSISVVVSLDGTMVYQHKYLRDVVSAHAMKEYAVPTLFLTQAPFDEDMRETFNADSTFVFFDTLRYADAWRVNFHRLRHRNFSSVTNRLLTSEDPLEFNPDPVVVSSDYDTMTRYTVNFLNAYLKGDSAGFAFLSRPPSTNGYAHDVVSEVHKRAWPNRFELVRRLQSASAEDIAKERERIVARVGQYSDLDAESLNDWAKVLVVRRPADALAGARVMTTLYPTFARGFVTAGVAASAAAGDSAAARYFRRAFELDSSMVWLKGWISQHGQR